MSKTTRYLARLAFASAAAAAFFVTPASANHSWGGYHWARTSNPFTLKVGDNVSSDWKTYLGTTTSDWSQSDVVDMVRTPGTTNRNCRAVKGTVQVCNAAYGMNGWLGVAQIWLTGSHITQATTKLNDSYFKSTTYNTPAWRNLVSCQEVGHTLGLDHQDENFTNANLDTCMDYTNDPSTNQHPNAHDYEELDIIYSHTDDTSTVASSMTPGTSGFSLPEDGGASPAEWGRPVAFTSEGKGRVYVLDVGGGKKLVTFVTWVPGNASPRR